MDDFRIPLSEREQAILGEQAAEEGHATAEDYAAAVLRAELRVKAQEKLEALLLEALDEEGEDEEWDEAEWEALRRRAAGE